MSQVEELVQRLAGEDRAAAAADVATLIKDNGVAAFEEGELLAKLKTATNDSNAALREGAFLALAAIAETVGAPAEPYLIPALPLMLERASDKVAPVRDAATRAYTALGELMNPQAVQSVLPELFAGMNFKCNWQTKSGSLNLLTLLSQRAPTQLAASLPEIVPVVSECMGDAKPQVKEDAITAMNAVCKALGNRDIEPFVPSLISCIARPAEVPDCVHKLGATTFVQAVEAPALSILVPLLVRGLAERQTAIKRKSCVIIDNMSKLVENPADAVVFLPRLMPGVERVSKEVADPECRKVATKAHATLVRVGAEGTVDGVATTVRTVDAKGVLATLADVVAKNAEAQLGPETGLTLEYIVTLVTPLLKRRLFDHDEWTACVTPYLKSFISEAECEKVVAAFVDRCYEEAQEQEGPEYSDDEGEDLCNCEFSLAYGAKILLNNATLRLKRGRRYGLCGPNGAGKSTLMRAIANGQVDGFPPKEELRTVYVEHDIDASEADTPVVEFIFKDPILQGASRPEHSQVEEVLASVGFTPEMQQQPVASLSGGWKMKLALARAMLMKADILLLDEPTNHLDVKNVAWLENYLTNLPDVTSMLVSHDSGFLDNVCTDITHYEGRKLRRYKGNLSEFVKRVPEAKSYYELSAASLKFTFPEPGFLEGIKSKDRAFLKMMNVGFGYPGTEKKILNNVCIQCSLSSRVAVLGANGAGKSTMIKLLTGELEPDEGTVWKHPNMRIAYVAQHAFHHIEKHLEKTPNQYIQWRYGIGEDREGLVRVDRTTNAEEEKKMQEKIVVDGEKRTVEKLVGRRKLKRTYEYEVQWVGLGPEKNMWMSRDKLEECGFAKMVNALDIKEAARLGLHTRPLTQAVIEKHLEDVGIDAEFGTHSHIRGLSGGQKVKVVLAAAMWNQPHLLVLDEPTNYLDRESLGALASAIKEFGGGVIMISHNREFTGALCPETWEVADGKLTPQGEPAAYLANMKLDWKPQEETVDAFGNIVKIKQPKKKLSRQEKKKRDKIRKARRDRGEEVSDSEDDEE